MQTTEAIADFIVSLTARGRADRTIGVYQQRLKVIERLGDIEEISPAQVDRVIAGIRGRWVALATLAGFIQAVKSFFRWAQRRGYIQTNPAEELQKPDLRHMARPVKAIAQGDLELLLDMAESRGLRLERAVLMLLADTGCRAGELASLDLGDVDLERCEAHCKGKTGEGDLDFTGATAEAIRAWLTVRPATDRTALFTTRRGRISYARVYDCIRILAHDLGIERHNPHSIRHRVGQGWIDQGANLELVRLKLRHRDISTTAMIYGNQDRGRIKAATRRYSIIKK